MHIPDRLQSGFSSIFIILFLLAGCSGKGNPVFLASNKPHPEELRAFPFRGTRHYRTSMALYGDEMVHTVRVRIGRTALGEVALAPYYPDGGSSKAYALADSVSVDGRAFTNAGIRSRGNTSIRNYKRQFKIALDCRTAYRRRTPAGKVSLPGNKDRQYSGAGKFNLRASQNDPSIFREKLAAWVFEEAGAPAPRVGFARLYINGAYRGLYLLTEQIDRHFLRNRYGTEKGSLYKGVRARARFETGSLSGFEVKNAPDASGRKRLAEQFRRLGRASSIRDLADTFHPDNALRYLAAAVLVGHWDSYARLSNNDYLWIHPDGRLRIIAWDLDNTFGSGIGWGFRTFDADISRFGSNSAHNRVFIPILSSPVWRGYYRRLVSGLLNRLYESGAVYRKIDLWKKLIGDAVREDLSKDVDWRFRDHDRANHAWDLATEDGPILWNRSGFRGGGYGLKTWLKKRTASVRRQLAQP